MRLRATFPSGLLVLLVVTAAACHTMRPLALEQLSAQRPKQVWVTGVDHSVVVLEGPHLVNNQLAGFVDDEYRVIPADNVERIIVRRLAAARTAALLAAGTAGALSLMFVLSSTEEYQHPCDGGTDECDPSIVP